MSCPHDETDHGICLDCGQQTDMNAHDYGKEIPRAGTGPRGIGLADYENPVFDGPAAARQVLADAGQHGGR